MGASHSRRLEEANVTPKKYVMHHLSIAQPSQIEDLCNRLSAFHISDKAQKLADMEEARRKRDERLPRPRRGQRPCWEPPELPYSWFEKFVEAEKELAKRVGSTDVAFRTEVHDLQLEDKLLSRYKWYILSKTRKEGWEGNLDHSFWEGLFQEVQIDHVEVNFDLRYKVKERHGKTDEEFENMASAVIEIAREKDAEFDPEPYNSGLSHGPDGP